MATFLFACPCVRKGVLTVHNLKVEYRDQHPDPLPTLTISTDYKPTLEVYRDIESYTVCEFLPDRGFDGRAVRLTKISDGDTRDVFIARNGQDNLCDCYGFVAHGRCKHEAVIRELMDNGTIPHPLHRPDSEHLPEYLEDFPIYPGAYDPFVDESPTEKKTAI